MKPKHIHQIRIGLRAAKLFLESDEYEDYKPFVYLNYDNMSDLAKKAASKIVQRQSDLEAAEKTRAYIIQQQWLQLGARGALPPHAPDFYWL